MSFHYVVRSSFTEVRIYKGIFCFILTIGLAFGLRMLEWPCWENPEFRFGNEMLLATHDAYHWVAGAIGFGRAVDHPMSIILRISSQITGFSPANIAFWAPAILASLVAGITFLWTWSLGSMATGIAAGLIASIAPGFLARTLLGYYDTDLLTLFFPLLISFGPALWVMRRVLPLRFKFRKSKPALQADSTKETEKKSFNEEKDDPLNPVWIAVLTIFGLVSWWCQEWHSLFPYIIRFNILLSILFSCCASRNRKGCLATSFAYAFPALSGYWGCLYGLSLLVINLILCNKNIDRSFNHVDLNRETIKKFSCLATISLILLGSVVLILLLRGGIYNTIISQIGAYLKLSGESHSSGGVSLIFPSVSQSIIEVQDLSFFALFPYFHPWLEAAFVGFAAYIFIIFKRPASLFLLPLAALALSSAGLGGRMVMFGAPIVAVSLSLCAFWIGRWLLRRVSMGKHTGWLVCLTLCGFLVAPFLDMIPSLSQGPILNRRHAAALAQAKSITPQDAILWLWWDWGYAAHYFSQRQTIADGAMHGGPSLYLPAAVFATDNPRFGRQIIKRTSLVNNEPGQFFSGLTQEKAQELINRLRSPATPLISGTGRQFIIVSFEMLKLGFWISNFGSWNFITCKGEGGALSIVPQALEYNLKTGEVRLEDSASLIFPASINVFQETGLIRRNYIEEWFARHPKATVKEQEAWLATRRNLNFLLNRVTNEKLAMDEGLFNSLMVQLLLSEPGDQNLAPYFKLVYDNVFARIYEVLP